MNFINGTQTQISDSKQRYDIVHLFNNIHSIYIQISLHVIVNLKNLKMCHVSAELL